MKEMREKEKREKGKNAHENIKKTLKVCSAKFFNTGLAAHNAKILFYQNPLKCRTGYLHWAYDTVF